MTDAREQHLLDEIAKRDAIIERQAAEIVALRQTIDALTRKIFGVSSEKLDPAQLEFLLEGIETQKPDTANNESTDDVPETKIKNHKKQKSKTRAPRIPDHLPVQREELVCCALIYHRTPLPISDCVDF